MSKQKLITVAGLVAAVAAATAGQIGALDAKAALYVTMIGAVFAAVGGAISKFLEADIYVTLTGVGVAVFSVLMGAGDLIGTTKAQIAGIIGAALTAIGKSLFGWDDDSSGQGAARGGVSFLLMGALIFGAMTQTACGNATTLERVGATVVQVSKAITAEAASLRAAGLLTPAKLDALDKKAKAIEVSAQALQSYLNSLPSVNAANKAEVLSKIGETLSLVSGLAQNADVVGLPSDNLFVKILTFGNITLQNAAIAIAALNPPSPRARRGTSSAGSNPGAQAAEDGVPLSSVKFPSAPVPKGAEKYLR